MWKFAQWASLFCLLPRSPRRLGSPPTACAQRSAYADACPSQRRPWATTSSSRSCAAPASAPTRCAPQPLEPAAGHAKGGRTACSSLPLPLTYVCEVRPHPLARSSHGWLFLTAASGAAECHFRTAGERCFSPSLALPPLWFAQPLFPLNDVICVGPCK